MKNDKGKPLSGIKSLGGWVLLVVISLGSFFITSALMRGNRQPEQSDVSFVLLAIGSIVLGGMAFFAAVAGYVIVLLTNCLTFNFTRPIWGTGLKARLYIANILVTTALLLGVGGIGCAIVGPIVSGITGLPGHLTFLACFLLIFIPGQLALTWFQLWTPLLRSLVLKRMAALGVSPEQVGTGIFAGISDPSVSSMKKFSMVEDDIGMLWIMPDSLYFQGDGHQLEIGRSQLLEIEREVDRGSISAYVGAVHIILSWQTPDGVRHRKRLHVENSWTLIQQAKMLDGLAHGLEEWKNASPPPTSGD